MTSSVNYVEMDGFGILMDTFGEKGVRKHMEDESLICPSLKRLFPNIPDVFDFSICAIFDGHAGRQSVNFIKENLAYEFASQISAICTSKPNNACVTELNDSNVANSINYYSYCYSDPVDDSIIKQIATKAFAKLDSRIATEITACKDGCTAIVVLIKSKYVYICNLGDSAGYLGRNKDGIMHAIPLVEPHKPWVVKEKERILRRGGTIENGRINGLLEITRSFGDISFKKFGVLCIPTFRKFFINPELDEFIIIACDGFWCNWTATDAIIKASELSTKELRRMSIENASGFNLRDICKSLVEYAIVEKKSQDNVSVLIVKILKQ